MKMHSSFPLRAALTATALLASAAASAETITFPSRAADLSDDAYWTVAEFGEGCCVFDFNIREWDGNSWEKTTGNDSNDQDFDWDMPLYAPANGVIASCWRNFPDDPAPGVEPPNNDQIFTGGNHVVILTDEGNAISINHFKSGTIPAELCPSNADDTEFPWTTDKDGQWRVAAYIDPADRPRVWEGEDLGRAGTSGNSGGPHLHMSLQPVIGWDGYGRELLGEAEPMHFRDVWGHPFDKFAQDTPEGWYRMRGGAFSGDPACNECDATMVHASPYLRRTSAAAGTVGNIDTLFLSADRAVTAVIDSAGEAKLIAWDLDGIDQLERQGDIGAGPAKDVRIVEAASNYVLAAVRTQSDDLKMIAYYVTPGGDFSLLSEHTAGRISALAMAATSAADAKAVTAVRDQSGNLKLIAWDIDFSNGGIPAVVRLGSASGGAVSALSISHARNFHGVFTAVRETGNTLKVIPWKLSSNGMTFTRGTHATSGTVGTQLAVAPLAQGVAAAATGSDGSVRFITWSASSSGNITALRDEARAGTASEIRMIGTPLAGSNLTTAVRDGSGELLLIGWLMNDDGTNLRRAGSSRAGDASKISLHGVSRSYPGLDPRDMILTAVRDGDNELKLITWDTNLVNP
jgi:hypothetical protein